MTINKKEIYQVNRYTYKNFVLLNKNEIKTVWEWRNHPEIRKWMTNDSLIPWENHLKFVESLKLRNDCFYWTVSKDGKTIGVMSIIDVNWEEKSCQPGHYLRPELLDSGEGLMLQYYRSQFLYNYLGFEKQYGIILVGNKGSFQPSRFLGGKICSKIIDNNRAYLRVVGDKERFNRFDESRLIKDFVQFSKKNPINWEPILKEY